MRRGLKTQFRGYTEVRAAPAGAFRKLAAWRAAAWFRVTKEEALFVLRRKPNMKQNNADAHQDPPGGRLC